MIRFLKDTSMGLALGLLLCLAATAPSCAHVGPVVTCLGQSVSAADLAIVEQDLRNQNYAHLVEMAVRIGWPLVECIIDNRAAAKPELAPAAKAFKRQHAAEMRGD